MKLVFDEPYGELSHAQRAAYRKLNVSPADHQLLTHEFGEDAHREITRAVKERSESGIYRHPFPR